MKKIIGINALFMIPNKVGGTEYHLRSFLNYLQKNSHEEEFVIFCNQENYNTIVITNRNFRKVLCPIAASNRLIRVLYEQTLLPILVQNEHCSLLHSFGYFGPILGNFKKIVTVHDANWKDFPEDTSILQNIVLNFLITRSIQTAEVVITDSNFSFSQLVKYFPEKKKAIKIIYPGLEDSFIQGLTQKAKHPLQNRNYILCVSAFYPHKKILYLLDLWPRVQEKYPNLSLVLIGSNGSQADAVAAKVQNLQSVEWYAKVSYAQLIQYYQHAAAAIFPSIYEGFGYPAYEAVAAGLPILVGKKVLYHPQLQMYLKELIFKPEKDIQNIGKLLQQRKNKPKLNFISYDHAAQQLLTLYQKLFVGIK